MYILQEDNRNRMDAYRQKRKDTKSSKKAIGIYLGYLTIGIKFIFRYECITVFIILGESIKKFH